MLKHNIHLNKLSRVGGLVAEAMWWVGCGGYVVGWLRRLCGGWVGGWGS